MSASLKNDAIHIWKTAVAAVDSAALVQRAIRINGDQICIGSYRLELDKIQRVIVVGGGKAGTGMARGLLQALEHTPLQSRVCGWVNVPDDCIDSIPGITIHGARPAGLNEPTSAGVQGTAEILELMRTADPHDLCICLISGGGSALMPAPVDGITLEDKQQITHLLSSHGANIQQLNCVRKKLSRIKGGQLAAQCLSQHLVSLIISDVLGDPLDTIASGPTVIDPDPADSASVVLHQFLNPDNPVVNRCLQAIQSDRRRSLILDHSHIEVIGNNRTAVNAAVQAANHLGYTSTAVAHTLLEGIAEEVGFEHARRSREMVQQPGKHVFISGGEPIVELADPDIRGKGGRNQQLILAALANQIAHGTSIDRCMNDQFILSGGTDGEDGPTDAAGAFIDAQILDHYLQSDLDIKDSLDRNDAYHFFQPLGGLLKTGPTHTNVCDIRVIATV